VKTSLQLPTEQVERVREVGGRLLREAPAYQRLVVDLKDPRISGITASSRSYDSNRAPRHGPRVECES
jgi:hypothetical protein